MPRLTTSMLFLTFQVSNSLREEKYFFFSVPTVVAHIPMFSLSIRYTVDCPIHKLRICDFAYMAKFICNFKINTPQHFCSHSQHAQSSKKNLVIQRTPVASWGLTRQHSVLFHFSYCKKVSFHGQFSAMVFAFGGFLLLFKMVPKLSVELLSNVLKCTKARMCGEDICQISFVRAWVIEMLAVGSLLMSQ